MQRPPKYVKSRTPLGYINLDGFTCVEGYDRVYMSRARLYLDLDDYSFDSPYGVGEYLHLATWGDAQRDEIPMRTDFRTDMVIPLETIPELIKILQAVVEGKGLE